jgi:hypothetical protein
LVDAKKVEFIEKKFLDMVKLLDAHKHENRGHYKETIEKLNKETEEKKILQSKLIVIKEEYKKLLASTKRMLLFGLRLVLVWIWFWHRFYWFGLGF